MSGTKVFYNETDKQLSVCLLVRAGDDPVNSAGTETFTLNPGQNQTITYGLDSAINIYLNGLTVSVFENGTLTSETEFVVQRGNDLDDELNKYSNVAISVNGSGFGLRTWN